MNCRVLIALSGMANFVDENIINKDNRNMGFPRQILFFFVIATLSSCKSIESSPTSSTGSNPTPSATPTPVPTSTPIPKDVTISWTASKSKSVNSSGGGYRVYYGTSSGVNPASASYINVPYVSGDYAPNSVVASWSSGNYYIKVVAYSSRASSEASSELKVVVP
jgi:hypothetical protein